MFKKEKEYALVLSFLECPSNLAFISHTAGHDRVYALKHRPLAQGRLVGYRSNNFIYCLGVWFVHLQRLSLGARWN